MLLSLFWSPASIGQEVGHAPQLYLDPLFKQYVSVRDVARSPSCSDIYVTIQNLMGDTSTIARIDQPDGATPALTVAPFSGTSHDLEPFLTRDGLRCYFASDRKRNGDTAQRRTDHDIWFVRRAHVDSAWGSVEHIDESVNSESNEFYPCVTSSGSIYFTSDRPGGYGFDDIYVSVKDTVQHAATLLPSPVNSPRYEFNAFVSDDEESIVFTVYNHPDGIGSGDLFVSHRSGHTWSNPISMGVHTNSKAMDYCPYFDDTRGLFYFTSKRNGKSRIFVQQRTLSP